jgi:MFS superfamily sulfate permease-like transporter
VQERVQHFVAAQGDKLRLVVWDLSTSPYVDIAGARLLRDVQRELAARDCTLRIVEARGTVRDLIRKEVGPEIGEISRRVTIDDVVAA